MPYKNITITPQNVSSQKFVKKSQFYKGFSTVDTERLNNKLFDIDLVKQDIMNILQTRKGERVMNPEFGTIVWSLLYEPFTDNVKQLISDDLTRIFNSDPRVSPTKINITEAPSGLVIEATLFYKQFDQSENMKLSFDKEIGLIAK